MDDRRRGTADLIRAIRGRQASATSNVALELVRKAVKELILDKSKLIAIDARKLAEYLGVRSTGTAGRGRRSGRCRPRDWPGPIVAASCSPSKGVMMPGKGRMTVTGNLRDVMKESISARRPMSARAQSAFGIERRCSTSATSTCMCRRGKPEDGHRPALQWSPPSSR